MGVSMYDIEIRDLSVYYDSVGALQNVNLNIKDKEFLGLIGPNGGGKTTLLKVLIGLLQPTTGSVLINRDSPIGYVPQFIFFDRNFPISVMDVVLMGKLPKKIRWFRKYSDKDKQCAEKVMKELGILDFKDRQIGQLSGGQLQKVLIARALIAEPKILILDEPTASLDSKTKKEIYEMLNKLNEDKTIIIASHDMGEIFSYIDSAAYINKTLHYYKNDSKSSNEILSKMQGYSYIKLGEKIDDKRVF